MVSVTPPRLGLGLVKDSLPAAAPPPKPERAGHPKPKQLAVPSVTYSVDGVLVMITNDHNKLHCPLTFFPQNIFHPYKKGTRNSKTMVKDIRGTQSTLQSMKEGKSSCPGIMKKINTLRGNKNMYF